MRGPARVIAGGIPMTQFAAMLTVILGDEGRLVVDKTGLGRHRPHRAADAELDDHRRTSRMIPACSRPRR
jgi:hypothetical protein